MPQFYPPAFTDPAPTVDGESEPLLTDGRQDTSLDITVGSLSALFRLAEGNATEALGGVFIYTDDGITTPVALSESGGSVSPDTITEFTAFRKLGKNFRLWQADLTGAPTLFRTHFTRDTTKMTGNVYQISVVRPAFLDIPNDGTFQRIDLQNAQRGRVVHQSIRGKDTVVHGINPSSKRRVAYTAGFQEKQLALDLIGIIEQYPHFFLVEDTTNFPENCYEAYMEDATVQYTYENAYRGSGFRLTFVFAER